MSSSLAALHPGQPIDAGTGIQGAALNGGQNLGAKCGFSRCRSLHGPLGLASECRDIGCERIRQVGGCVGGCRASVHDRIGGSCAPCLRRAVQSFEEFFAATDEEGFLGGAQC